MMSIVTLHSWLRWFVLIFFVVAIFKHFIAAQKNIVYDKKDKILDIVLVSLLDINLLLGIYLYMISPLGMEAYKLEGFMHDKILRKTSFEHPILMFIAIIIAHIAGAQRKKVIPNNKKHKKIAILFLVSLILILVGIPRW